MKTVLTRITNLDELKQNDELLLQCAETKRHTLVSPPEFFHICANVCITFAEGLYALDDASNKFMPVNSVDLQFEWQFGNSEIRIVSQAVYRIDMIDEETDYGTIPQVNAEKDELRDTVKAHNKVARWLAENNYDVPENEFKQKLLESYNVSGNRAEYAYESAYSIGHGNGYGDILRIFDEMASLL